MIRAVTLLILISTGSLLSAQTNDAGAWINFTLEKDLPKKFTTGIELETRLNDNLSEVRSIFSEVYLAREWNDAFSTTLTYRAQARRRLDNNYENRDRVALDLKYKIKVGEIGVQYRFRAQRQLGVLGTESSLYALLGARHKIKLDYDMNKKWELSLAGESFYSAEREAVLTHTDIRLKIGGQYKIKKRNYLSLGYLVQREYNTNNPFTNYNLTVSYKLMIK